MDSPTCHSEPRRRRGIPRVRALIAHARGIPRFARDDTDSCAAERGFPDVHPCEGGRRRSGALETECYLRNRTPRAAIPLEISAILLLRQWLRRARGHKNPTVDEDG